MCGGGVWPGAEQADEGGVGLMERREIALDPAVASILTRRPAVEERPKRHRSEHERERVGRRLSLTLPDAEWRMAIEREAERCGIRVSDFVTWCVARGMRAIEEGEARPRGEVQFWQRAGEPVRLPWEP